jgi:hypothetical protein
MPVTQKPRCRNAPEGVLRALPRMDRPEGQHGGVGRAPMNLADPAR